MSKLKKQSFIQGAIILSLSMIIVKIIGAIFKLPLTSILGGEGMGYFSSSYTIFNLFSSISSAGIPIAVSKIVAEKVSLGRYRDVKRVLKLSLLVFSFIGIILSLSMFFLSNRLSEMLNNNGAYYSIAALSPSIFFICIMSIYRGYYQGLSQMYPTAKSQIIESLVKMIFGLLISYFVFTQGNSEYLSKSTVFGKYFSDDALARDYIMQLAAAGAVLGITFSCFVGYMYLVILHKIKGDSITKKMLKSPQEIDKKRFLIKSVMKTTIPIAVSSIIINITSVIDLGSILTRITVALSQDIQHIVNMYKDALPDGITIDKIPNFLYGSYAGMAVTIFNLIPSFTVSLGISALPSVASANIQNDKFKMQKQISSILKTTSIFVIPAGIGIYFLSYPILNLLFESQKGSVIAATTPLSYLGIAAIFVSLTIPLNSILQGIGRVDLPVKLMLIGSILKLIINYFLVSVPSININGAPIGTIVCYSLIFFASMFILVLTTGIRLNYVNIFFKPIICGLFCGIVAKSSYNVLYSVFSTKYVLIPAIFIGFVIYIISILFLKTIDKDDIKTFPKGDYISNKINKTK